MSEESRSASNSDGPVLADSERAQLVYAIRRCAREKGLSPAVAERYQAWIFAFVSWCRERSPHRVDRGRIGPFRDALQQSSDASEEDVYQAMDALAFLFGAVDEVVPLLAAHDAAPEDGTASASSVESGGALGGEGGPQTLQVGWQSGGEASDETIRAPQIPPERAPDTTLTPVPTAEETTEEETETASTAELCIERFQTQVESLHAPDADASEPSGRGAEPDLEAHPEPNASSA